MSAKLICAVCCLFLLSACADKRLAESQRADGSLPGESLEVYLSLDVTPPASPLSPPGLSTPASAAAHTRSGREGSFLRAPFGGMEVELSGEPVAATRSLQQAEEDKIYSATILQFNGTF